jgi:hypothetical protein
LKLYELFEDRVEQDGPISNELFRAILAAVVTEFEAEEARRQSKGRRGTKRSRGRPAKAPADDMTLPDFDIQELH